MPSERIQRRIDSLLDEADEAYARHDWAVAEDRASTALGLAPDNEDAGAILAAVARMAGAPTSEATERSLRILAPQAIVRPPRPRLIFPPPSPTAGARAA